MELYTASIGHVWQFGIEVCLDRGLCGFRYVEVTIGRWCIGIKERL